MNRSIERYNELHMNTENFIVHLKLTMKKNGLNQLETAKLLGVRQSQVSNWLHGKSMPGFYSLLKLKEKLGLAIDKIFN